MKAAESEVTHSLPVPAAEQVAASFSRCATSYDSHAALQQRVARDALSLLNLSQGQSVLDIGCGTGCHTHAIARMGATAQGLDLATGMVAHAARMYPELAFHQGHAEALPFPNQSFDQVFSSMALQWCQSPFGALAQMQRVLVKGGKATLAIMVDGSFEELDRARRLAGITVATNPQASHSQWCEAAARAGLTVREAKLMSYEDSHSDILSLLRSIKHTGAGVTTAEGKALSRQDLKKLTMTYPSRTGEQSSFTLTYKVSQLILEN